MEILHIETDVQERWKDLNCKVSFGSYLRFFKDRREKDTSVRKNIYDYIISSFEAHPELLEPFDDLEILNKNSHLIELLQMSLLPVAGSYDNDPIGFGPFSPPGSFTIPKLLRTC